MISTLNSFSVLNEAEVGVFLTFPCFLSYPINVGNLTSGSSAYSKSRLNIWKFMLHVLLKPGSQNFEHYYASIWKWKLLSHVWLPVTPQTIWIEPWPPAFQVDSLPAEPQGMPKNTGVGSLSLLQWNFPTQVLNQGFLHWRQILYQLSYPNFLNIFFSPLYVLR